MPPTEGMINKKDKYFEMSIITRQLKLSDGKCYNDDVCDIEGKLLII